MKIHSNGVDINVHDAGQGEPAIVFLHYWGGSSRTWRHVTGLLAPSFRTIAMDQRGWGESGAGTGDYGIATLAADAMGVVEALDLERYVVVGHSMGGKVAQWIAASQPKGLAGAVLVAPASPSPSILPEEQRAMLSRAYDSRDSVLWSLENVLTAHALAATDAEQVVADSLRGTPGAKLAWPMQSMCEDISAMVPRIQVPVLIVAGELDRVDPPAQVKAEVLARIPTASLHELPGTGHLSPLESPQAVSAAIAGFMEEITGIHVRGRPRPSCMDSSTSSANGIDR